jgi:alkylhydroperoxidase family enzyme
MAASVVVRSAMAEIPSIAKDTLTIVQGLSERERIALEYAGRVSATPIDVPDDFFARLRPRFSEREIVELTAHIAQENYNAKSNRPLRVDANNFCEIPLPASKT